MRRIFQKASNVRFFSEKKDFGEKSVRQLLLERYEELYDFYKQNHPSPLPDPILKYHVFKFAQEKGKMSTQKKSLSPNCTLEEAIKSVTDEKIDSNLIEIHIIANDYIDFSGIDSRIKLHEPWHETHPMRLTISVPKIHAEEIVIKLRKHPGIIEIDADLIEEPVHEVRNLK